MVNFQEFQKWGFHNFTIWDFEILRILKEREGYNLGDGKFSGFPNFRISGIGKFGDRPNSKRKGKLLNV